ncbi:RNA polymerase sigma factor [Haloplasma contractile]|uniref:RNA polymerase sigma factor protein n=1 Tax=Haloplasma contractile SSD-17B TaxID=1033810 RepID=F7Q139_9MOLU|nr:sigma-70 family RNA polymerase sigma factor [Haloplasma contractile]ERJ11320.1 RNA polymerase sigma factor protein [Haloplasma contractile SSD-17B]
MDDTAIVEKIKEAVEPIFAYSLKRTNNRHEAEDLSQEILLNLYDSYNQLKDERKFYGWMWAVANNVFKTYLRKKGKNTHIEFNEQYHIEYENRITDQVEEQEELGLIFREISILSGLYRETMMLYYIKERSCAQIAEELSMSENMVKQYLFKSRKKVKEGVNMIRERGERSFNPRRFSIYYWGNSKNYYHKLFKRKLPGNIMLETFYSPITTEQLSVELGVASVYLEDEIDILLENNLLTKKSNKFQSNIVIFTKEFEEELYNKTKDHYAELANDLNNFINEKENLIRSIGFKGADLPFNTLKWQLLSITLYEMVIERFLKHEIKELPSINKDYRGYVWGMERDYGDQDFDIGINGYTDDSGNALVVMDYALIDKKYQDLCSQITGDTLLKIASEADLDLNKYEENELLSLIKEGYVYQNDGLTVNMPVFTKKEFRALKELLEDAVVDLYHEFIAIIPKTEKILKNYVPKKITDLKAIVSLKQVESFIVEIMNTCYLNNDIHLPKPCHDVLSAYIIVNK